MAVTNRSNSHRWIYNSCTYCWIYCFWNFQCRLNCPTSNFRTMNKLLSQVPIGNITGVGVFGNPGPTEGQAFTKLSLLISTLLGFMTLVAGLYFLFQIFISAFGLLSSGGDKQQIQTAQKRLLNAILGLIIVVSAYALTALVGYVLGLNILNPYEALQGIPPGGGEDPPCIPPGPC